MHGAGVGVFNGRQGRAGPCGLGRWRGRRRAGASRLGREASFGCPGPLTRAAYRPCFARRFIQEKQQPNLQRCYQEIGIRVGAGRVVSGGLERKGVL
mgnify:CR=1 FL=1